MMTIDAMIEVLQAVKDRKAIQVKKHEDKQWRDSGMPSWDFYTFEYRIKPEPKIVYLLEYSDGSYSIRTDPKTCFPDAKVRKFIEVIE